MATRIYDYCQYWGCKVNKSKGAKLFRFPRDPEKQKIWIEMCGKFHINFEYLLAENDVFKKNLYYAMKLKKLI